MKIAIVEDEAKLAKVLEGYLLQAGYDTTIYAEGNSALNGILSTTPDLVLLDLMLPGVDGISICREVRKQSSMPIIMLTARVEEIDRLLGLEIGADDYICKPYSPREVVARVKAVLRRSQNEMITIASNDFHVDEATARASVHGESIELTAVELRLLKVMSDSPGQIFNRGQLMARIYSDNRVVSDRTIDSHVKKLRQKLESLSDSFEFVHSVYGIGYKFDMVEIN